jgi:hypothetical protein
MKEYRRHTMRRYVIERDLPAIGTADATALRDAARTSCDALAKLAPSVQWEHSYVTHNKTFCIYLAANEEAIREHARLSGFPASVITEVTSILDPVTAER